jgi:hypothetical protein
LLKPAIRKWPEFSIRFKCESHQGTREFRATVRFAALGHHSIGLTAAEQQRKFDDRSWPKGGKLKLRRAVRFWPEADISALAFYSPHMPRFDLATAAPFRKTQTFFWSFSVQ